MRGLRGLNNKAIRLAGATVAVRPCHALAAGIRREVPFAAQTRRHVMSHGRRGGRKKILTHCRGIRGQTAGFVGHLKSRG